MTEGELLAHVLEAAAELGVMAHHELDSRRAVGDPGFPDLVLAGQLVEFWELKSATAQLDPDQHAWSRRINSSASFDPDVPLPFRVVRPDMWPGEVYALLRKIRGQ